MNLVRFVVCLGVLGALTLQARSAEAQTAVTATLQGQVLDSSGGAVPKASVSAVNAETGFSRSTKASDSGDYSLQAMPVGRYTVTAQAPGFKTAVGDITLQVGQVATLNLTLTVGAVSERVVVEAESEVTEPTRTQISNVITPAQIEDLPVNGREFIDFALLAPGVQIGNTTSGSTDVIVEPVTKLSFAGQNIHYNFIAVDGADDISTASGIQRGTPPQESVQEFRVINTDYTVEYGRATAGIVNIITKSGTNDFHGSLYEYFRNDALDAKSILSAPGFNILRQNQFGGSVGGPIKKDKTFFFANYEGQRRGESPTYNSVVLQNIGPMDGSVPNTINSVKVHVFNLPPENLAVLRTADTDNGLVRVDHNINSRNYIFARYFINDDRLLNQSPLNNGFDLPSAFKNNFIRDQSVAGGWTSTFAPSWVNELRMQYAHRTFDFPVVSTQPHLEVSNEFAVGVNRGNPDIYREWRYEVLDNLTHIMGNHTLSFGGNFDYVSTYESFPLFYPFEADFANLRAFLGTDGAATHSPGCVGALCPDPFVIFFERFDPTTLPTPFNDTTVLGGTAVYQGGPISQTVRQDASGKLNHTYEGFYVQDKWRATSRLTVNAGLRWEFETWPSGVLKTQWGNVDPRIGLAYNLGTSHNVVFRAGVGLFHGTIPSNLLMCQEPSCGGLTTYPGRPFEDGLNARTGLFTFASSPFITTAALGALLTRAEFPNGDTTDGMNLGCPGGTLAGCGFLQDATIVRFVQNYKNPYGIQASASLEFQPFKDSTLDISGIHLRGVHLGSFFNVNQPDPSDTIQVFDSKGQASCKNVYFNFAASGINPAPPACEPYPAGFVIPNTPHINAIPGFRNNQFSVFFEAAPMWDSVYDGLLVNFNKRLTHHFSAELSYTYAHSIDDGPNPSFVLIPQDSNNGNFRLERASSADDVRHRFVGNAIFASPWTEIFLRDFTFSTIVTLQSPQYFTKYAGFDANGDVFGTNDRVGSEPRNTFKGDTLETVDIRLERTFPIRERLHLQLMAEAFNLLNKVNIRYFNTNYGAADFCGPDPGAPGCAGAPAFFLEKSPNPSYGTPSAVFNPRQLQFVARFQF